jgi:adenine-specific DNA-methyltransferase
LFRDSLNVYHANRRGFSPNLATGLSIYLNSTFVDRYFRQFNGHTQVNATDLRALRYPTRDVLERIGKNNYGRDLSQQQIDAIIDSEIAT